VGPGASRGDHHRLLMTPERVLSEYSKDMIFLLKYYEILK